ncbi:MAG: hypothetical protein HY042_00590 [Spirochaetia bacterium]|nr:hypothetical protein [Spirochaetia bacterium]
MIESVEEGTLLGLLSRELLDRELADWSRAQSEHQEIPPRLITRKSPPEEELLLLMKKAPLPVLDRTGLAVKSWTGPEILSAVSALKEALPSVDAAKAPALKDASKPGIPLETAAAKDDGANWLTRLILASFPDPLFAADLKGNSLFFNEAFERFLSGRDALKNSIRITEKYFLEMTRDLIAGAYAAGPPAKGSVLARTYVPVLKAFVSITAIEKENGEFIGYLYNLRDAKGDAGGAGTDLVPLLDQGMGLEQILAEVEAGIINKALVSNGQNISHAAAALRIKRSTLQNRMKLLDFEKRFPRRIEGPIRRSRSGQSGGEPQQEPTVEAVPSPVTPKKAGKSAMRDLVHDLLKERGQGPVKKSKIGGGKNRAPRDHKKKAPGPGKPKKAPRKRSK